MNNQSFDKNYDVKSKTSHREAPKPQDLDIESEFIVLPTGKSSFERDQSYKNSCGLKGDTNGFYKKQEQLNTASKALTDRINQKAILLSANKPISGAILDENPKDATKICGEDQDSSPNLYKSNLENQHQEESLKADSNGLRSHLFALKFQTNSFNSLQDLDLARCLLGKHTIQALCCNYDIKSLKSLILTQNPIRNDGVKFISQNSNWQKLQKLILCEVYIDCDGVKWLAMNESWKSLKELDLSENPLIGDLGATSLCLNRTWKSLNTLSLWGCNVGTLGVIASRRRRNYGVLFAKDKTTIEVENQNFIFKKVSFGTTCDTQNHEKNLPTYPFTYSNRHLQNFKSTIRGGSPQDDGSNDSSDIDYSRLLTKFQQYKAKILNDASLEKELKLFIEVQASNIPADHYGTNNKSSSDMNQHLELSFDLRTHLLYCEGSEASKILLLTGQAGSGKSLFCKHLQRELLSDWSQNPESEDRNWFPIYIELSSMKTPKSEAISETLSKELSLTNEEILLLKASEQSNPYLHRLLFIFDGYDTVEDIHAFHSLRSRRDYMNHNFFVLSKIDGESWKNAKFVVACREENLQKVQRRDLLFAPINTESSELSIASRSLLQRRIEPFSNEQITCFLKKYYCYEPKDTVEQTPSWNQAMQFEKIIDDFQLREMARIPFMLWIMCQILPKLVKGEPEQINEVKFVPHSELSMCFLIEFFVNEVIKSMTRERLRTSNGSKNKEDDQKAQKEEKKDQQVFLHNEEIRPQAQNLALKLRGYTTNQAANKLNQYFDPLTLKLNPIIKWDNRHIQAKFDYPFLFEFFVAKGIEEEIREVVPSTQDEWLKMDKTLLINQRFLTIGASDAIVILFLVESIKAKRLTATQFINLIQLSRQNELDQENESESTKDIRHASRQNPFAAAATNAITILNTAGHDFSHQDLSNINIPEANLSCGVFEATKFRNANLAGVDFTGAWLRDANFINANLEKIEFGELRSLKLPSEEILNIAYSWDEKHFAVDVGDETVIFKVADMQRNYLKEIKRIPGYFLRWGELGGTQVVTIVGERILMEDKQLEVREEYNKEQEFQDNQKQKRNVCFCIWDAISGQSIEKFNVPIGNKRLLSFNSERKEVIALHNRNVQKYDINSQSWIQFPVKIWNGVKTRNLFARKNNTLLVGDYLGNTILCSLITGKAILKQRQRVTSCKLSSDGQKTAAGTSHGVVHISDCVRGYIIKSLVNQSREGEKDELKTVFDCSFNADGKQILSRTQKSLTLRDIAGLTLTNIALPPTKSNNFTVLNYLRKILRSSKREETMIYSTKS